MRLILNLSKNKEIIPYNYQPKLVSCIHKWIGKNNKEHNDLSLYSFSWLLGTTSNKDGINTSETSHWCISFYDEEIIKKIIQNIQLDPYVFCGIEVTEIQIQQPAEFLHSKRFNVANPVFIQREVDNKKIFYYSHDKESDELLTLTLKNKLNKAGLKSEGVSVSFDRSYPNPKTKGFTHNNIFNKGTVCPIIISGTPEQIAFAWIVGVGNSTGIGFGALV